MGRHMNTAAALDARTSTSEQSPPGEEQLRFIRNFHDVFLSIGLGLFTLGLGFVTSLLLAENMAVQSFSDLRRAGWIVALAYFADAAILWAAAELFARSRRLFLPSIVILVGFAGFVFAGMISAYAVLFIDQDYDSWEQAARNLRFMPLALLVATTVAVFAYYVRMKLPFAMGLGGALAATSGVAGAFALAPEAALGSLTLLQFLAGLFLFGLGIAFDARDPTRQTRFSDNAFWLHFFAGPLIFSAVMTMVSGGGLMFAEDGPFVIRDNIGGSATLTLAVVLVFAVISLLINRRALLVSGLLSAAVAIGVLVRQSGLDGLWTGAVTLLLLGSVMVLLGGGWNAMRRILLAPFPKSGPISRIFPPPVPAGGGES